MNTFDAFDLLLVALATDSNECERQYWVHPLNTMRPTMGEFHCLYGNLRKYPDRFFGYYRMSISSFDELLFLVRDSIAKQTTHMREPISPEERLTVTLRYLATGSQFSAMQYPFKMGERTISSIVNETCEEIWRILQPLEMPTPTRRKWQEIAHEFYRRTNFPNCIGAVDGKHIRLVSPSLSGSDYFCYKKFFSIVLMAIADANYCFTVIDVGSYGRESDNNIFKESEVGKCLYANELNLPNDTPLPNTDQPPLPYVLIGDEAFALHENLLRPFPSKNLDSTKRIFNYRLSRGRRYVECTFGILCKKFGIFYTAMSVNPDFAAVIVKAATVIHNFVRRRDGYNFEDTLSCDLEGISARGTGSRTIRGQDVREQFANYFVSPAGAVQWQNKMARV